MVTWNEMCAKGLIFYLMNTPNDMIGLHEADMQFGKLPQPSLPT